MKAPIFLAATLLCAGTLCLLLGDTHPHACTVAPSPPTEPVVDGAPLRLLLDAGRRATRCALCGARIRGAQIVQVEGRPLCPVCFAKAAHAQTWGLGPVDVEAEAARVRSIMADALGLVVHHEVRVHIVDEDQMRRIADSPSLAGQRGDALSVIRLKPEGYELFLLPVLDRPRALRVLAHELGHAYYEENHVVLKDPLQREGFAEWVAYRVLGAAGFHEEQRELVRRRDVYGQGLRSMLDAERRGGVEAVLDEAMR